MQLSLISLLSLVPIVLGLSAGDLKVSIKSTASKVNSVDDVLITTVVSNPTADDIRVIARNNILDADPTRSFSVSKDGKDVIFTGLRTSVDLTHESSFVTIPAGKSVAVNHTVAALYDFESHGTGTFSFSPNALFQTAAGEQPLVVDVDALSIDITSDVAQRTIAGFTRRSVNDKRAAQQTTPSCGDSGRYSTLVTSLASARSLAGGAATDVQTHPTSTTFNQFFGGNNPSDVWYRFDLIAGDLPSAGVRTLYCNSDPAGICTGGVVAYTLLSLSGGQILSSDVYTCDIFYTLIQPTPSVCGQAIGDINNSQGGVILHELSHATSATNDIAYGCQTVQSLSASDKFNNADNYQCMGLNIYKIYNC